MKTVGIIRKRKSLQTDGRMDPEGYNTIRPFLKRAYKTEVRRQLKARVFRLRWLVGGCLTAL